MNFSRTIVLSQSPDPLQGTGRLQAGAQMLLRNFFQRSTVARNVLYCRRSRAQNGQKVNVLSDLDRQTS